MVLAAGAPGLPLDGLTGLLLGPLDLCQSVTPAAFVVLLEEEAFLLSVFGFPAREEAAGFGLEDVVRLAAGVSGVSGPFLVILLGAADFSELDLATIL